MFKLNNKGFAVSAVLYTLLIAFLMFLGVTLAQFSSSITLINNANKDLVDGQVPLSATPITAFNTDASGKQDDDPRTDIKVQIKSKYGTMYWPKDFVGASCNSCDPSNGINYKNIKIDCTYDENNRTQINLIIRDQLNSPDTTYVEIKNPCNFTS